MNILFVSHAATRGGAAGVLLELLRTIQQETAHQSTLLTLRPGPLETEFASLVTPFPQSAPLRRATLLAGASRRLTDFSLPRKPFFEETVKRASQLNARVARRVARASGRFDWVYANSAASGDAVRALEPILSRGSKLLVHVHELAFALSKCEPGWTFLKRHGDFFIAASGAVRDELINQGISPQRIEVVYEWLDFSRLETDKDASRMALMRQIGVPEEAVIIGGCGTMEHRKGTDWWVQSAFHALGVEPNARKTPAPLHFAWLGAKDDAYKREIMRDVRGYGIESRVHFLPPSNEPQNFFAGLDAFCLSSREDPFPLVAVEAAAQSVPTVCFAKSGGAPELVGQNGGVIVPWGDCAAMGRALASLGRDADFRAQLGRGVHKRALELCDAQRNCAQVVAILERDARSSKFM